MSYDKLGDVAQASGDLVAARGYFEKGQAIIKALSEADPHNAQWQIDLAVSHKKLAEVAHATKDVAAFRAHRDAATAILDRLERNGKVTGNDLFTSLRRALTEMKE